MLHPVVAYEDWVKMGQRTALEDGEVFYVQKGEGVPIVMLHHGGGNSCWWSRILDAFATHYSVYVLDFPGFAQSETPVLPYDIPDFATSVIGFMDRLGIDKAHLLGNSMGSQVGVHLATTRPERIHKLVLDIFPHWTRTEGKRLWLEVFRGFLDKNDQPIPFEEWDVPGDNFMDLDEETAEVAIQRMAKDFNEHADWWVTTLKVAQLRYDVNPRLSLIQAPTLVVVGEKGSRHIREGQEQVIRAIKRGRLTVIPEAGNRCHFEQPALYSRLALEFLSE